MKTSIILTSLTLATMLGGGQEATLVERLHKTNATIAQAQEHWVVVLSGAQSDYVNGRATKLSVEVVSASAGAPRVNPDDNIAESLAELIKRGATITVNASGYLTYTAIK